MKEGGLIQQNWPRALVRTQSAVVSTPPKNAILGFTCFTSYIKIDIRRIFVFQCIIQI